jgi:hypothetical protein
MADNQFNIKVVVTDAGGIKLAEKNIRQLGAAVQKTGTQYKQTAKESEDLYKTQAKGVIGTANSTRSFSKLAQTIGNDGSSGLVGAYATLAANIFAVTAAFTALRGASQVEQIFRGLEAAGTRTGRSLINTAKALREVTGDAISTEESMRSTAQIMAAGFDNSTVVKLGQAARDTSFALGRNMTDALERLTRGIVKLEPELLDELGLMTKLGEASATYALKLGKTESQLTNFEKRQGFANAILAEAELKFGGISDAAADSTNYDKLAATFVDLTNQVFKFVNIIATPIAGGLSNSMLLLSGIGVLFGNTLKNQLVPGWLDAAGAASKSAAKLKESAEGLEANVVSARNLVKAQKEQRISNLANLDYVGNKAPKAYAQLSNSIKTGAAAPGEYTKAIISLNRSVAANQALMKNNPLFGEDTERGKAKLAEIENARKQAQAVSIIQNARRKAEESEIKDTKRVREAKNQAAITASLAAREESVSTALNAAANGEYRKSLTSIKDATLQHHQGLKLSSAASLTNASVMTRTLVPALNVTKTSFYGVGLAARATGVAMLNAIPVIGTVLMLLGLASIAWDSLKSEKTKAMESALEELNTIASKTNGYLAEMARINATVASEAQKASLKLTIQSNAIRETSEAYTKLKAARDFKDTKNAIVGTDDVEGMFGSDRLSYFTGLEKSSKVLASVRENLAKSQGFLGGLSKNEDYMQLKGAAVALNNFAKDAPEVVNALIDLNGGWEKFSKLPIAGQLRVIDKINKELVDRFGSIAQEVKELEEAFKGLEDATAAFVISSVPKTKYDDMVKNLNSVSTAITQLEIAGKRAGNSAEIKNLFTKLGTQSLNLLTPDTAKALENLKVQEATVQTLQKQKNETGKLRLEQAIVLSNAEGFLKNKDEVINRVKTEIGETRKLFLQAQMQERTSKSQLDLLNAHIQANGALYAAAGAGLRAKIVQEEKVRAIQATQLQTELNIQQAMIAQAEIRLEGLKTADLELQKKEELLSIQNELNRAVLLEKLTTGGFDDFARLEQGILTKQNYLSSVSDPTTETAKNVANLVDSYNLLSKSAEKIDADRLARLKDIETTENVIRDAQANIVNLKNQIAVLNEQNLTAGQKLALIRQADNEFQRTALTSLEEQRKTVLSTLEVYDSINQIVKGTTDSLESQVNTLKKSFNVQRDTAEIGAKKQIASLKDDLRVAIEAGKRANLSKEEKEAAIILTKNIRTQITLQEQGLYITLGQINAQEALALAQKIYFDTTKEGVEWQKTSFDWMQKELDATKSLNDETQKIVEARTKLAYKKSGIEIGQTGQQALEIRAANQAYKLALDEVSVKRGLIDLEFALLDAQKEQLISELRFRKSGLDASKPENAVRLAQIEAVLGRIENVDFSVVADNAKTLLDKQVESAQLNLETALTRSVVQGGIFSEITSLSKGINERRDAKLEAEKTLKEATSRKFEVIVKPETMAEKKDLEAAADPIISSNNLLVSKIGDWINTIEKIIGSSKTDLKSDVLNLSGGSIKSLGSFSSGGSKQKLMEGTLAALVKAGFSLQGAIAIGAEIGRENSFRPELIFGSHSDPYNKAHNAGLISWQGNRGDSLRKNMKGLTNPNGSFKKSQASLDSQAVFLANEMKQMVPQLFVSLTKSTVDFDKAAKQLGTRFVKWRFTDPEFAEGHVNRDMFRNELMNLFGGSSSKAALESIEATDASVKLAEEASIAASNESISVVLAAKKALEAVTVSGTKGISYAANDNTKEGIIVEGSKAAENVISDTTVISTEAAKQKATLGETLDYFTGYVSEIKESLSQLGPEGEIVLAISSGMINIVETGIKAFEVFNDKGSSLEDKFVSVAAVVSSALSMVQSALAASAQAKEDAVQREIDAEQKRDGKSAESVAKIAALEKKKDDIARKQFNTNKKLMMAQAVIGTAAGIAGALGSLPGPPGIILAGIIGAMGAAQLAIIAGTQYQSANSSNAGAGAASPSLNIGKRGDTVDLARQNTNVGGEIGYLRGSRGLGTNSSNYQVIGSAYGGDLPRGYGSSAYVVGEKGPETITPETPITVRPANDNSGGSRAIDATFNIHALDSKGVAEILEQQKGNIISMLREAANANGQTFLESVDTNVYTRPNVSKL